MNVVTFDTLSVNPIFMLSFQTWRYNACYFWNRDVKMTSARIALSLYLIQELFVTPSQRLKRAVLALRETAGQCGCRCKIPLHSLCTADFYNKTPPSTSCGKENTRTTNLKTKNLLGPRLSTASRFFNAKKQTKRVRSFLSLTHFSKLRYFSLDVPWNNLFELNSCCRRSTCYEYTTCYFKNVMHYRRCKTQI